MVIGIIFASLLNLFSHQRIIYSKIKFADVVYVLHSFQKKSKQGIATPKQDIDLIETRLKRAKEHYSEHYNKK